MKKAFIIISLFLGFSGISQSTMDTAKWQEDIRYLQTTVHKDYPFLFKKVSAEKFDEVVEALYNEAPNLEDHEIRVGLSRLVALFEYGHTQFPYSYLTKSGIFPINLFLFNDGLYIEGVHKDHQKALGAKVIKIGETPIEKALELVRPVVPVENDSYFKAYGMRFLLSPEVLHAQRIIPEMTTTVSWTLEKDGETFTYDFPTIPREEKPRSFNFTVPTENWLTARDISTTPYYLKYLAEKFYYFEYLENDKTVYVRQSSVFDHESESLKEFYKRLFDFIDTNDVEKLVYDVRLNGGGNNYNNLNLIKGLLARPEINSKGKFFFIIGRDTFSACQNLTNEITTYTEAILVGEPTAENVNFYGDNRPVRLPNSGLNAYLSFAWWQDKPQWENRDATLPHIAVDMSYEEYITNADPVLEAAMNFKDDGFILDPMQHLTQLFMTGDLETLKSDAFKIAKDPKYRYYDFKEEFSNAGNRVKDQGNLQGALFIFKLMSELYPDSTGTWFSLANVQKDLEQFENAIASYQKIIDLEPKGMMARSAKQKIEALKKL
ncbi:S41 family peptidase [Winogradskyella tangerina]|uniref:tetratricopeptide repeat protein n=1 Tax=Winogradskyella tangerina TaxID=2023240 RepID=UPI000DBE5BCE|nr:tetratricopeptide repeat protein [Winogradskyella tangerina]